MLRAVAVATQGPAPFDVLVLTADERHLRRRVLTSRHGERVLVDLPVATRLRHRDRLALEDGRHVEVIAADESLYEARVADPAQRARVAWALGNRHARIEIVPGAIRLAADHVLRDMLARLGAEVVEVRAPFEPEAGGAHAHAHPHFHPHAHS